MQLLLRDSTVKIRLSAGLWLKRETNAVLITEHQCCRVE